MAENQIKGPLLKAVIFALILEACMLIASVIIYSMQIEPIPDNNISGLFLIVHTFWVGISITIGIIIIKINKFKWDFAEIGIRAIEKNTLKNIFYLFPFFIIGMLPLLGGINTNTNTFKVLSFWALHFLVVGIHEEFYNRGIILSLFKDNFKKAIIISSIIFGMGHITNMVHIIFNKDLIYSEFLVATLIQMVFAFIIGVVYAEIVVITKSILPVIFFHAFWNFTATISNGSDLIFWIQTLLLIIFAIIMWIKIFKKSPNCT